jgi:hypothetical protein
MGMAEIGGQPIIAEHDARDPERLCRMPRNLAPLRTIFSPFREVRLSLK